MVPLVWACGFSVDEHFEVGLCAQWWQCAHGEVQLGEVGLHVANSLVDGLPFLEQFDAACAHELGGIDEPCEVYTAVFYCELGVRGEQLLLFVEDGVPMLFLLHFMVQVVALFLEAFSFGLAFGTAQGVGMVAVGDR